MIRQLGSNMLAHSVSSAAIRQLSCTLSAQMKIVISAQHVEIADQLALYN